MVVTDIMEKLYSIFKCCLCHMKQLTSLLPMAIRVINSSLFDKVQSGRDGHDLVLGWTLFTIKNLVSHF